MDGVSCASSSCRRSGQRGEGRAALGRASIEACAPLVVVLLLSVARMETGGDIRSFYVQRRFEAGSKSHRAQVAQVVHLDAGDVDSPVHLELT